MSLLLKPIHKTLNPYFILRRFSTHTVTKCFPDNPTSAYYDEITAEAGNSGDLNALRDILNKRIQDYCFNTKRTFSFITDTNLTPSLLNDVVGTLSNLNPGFTRKSAFDSLITRLCKLKRVDDALHVTESMVRIETCHPTSCTFHPIINLVTRETSLDHARRVEELVVRLGLQLDLKARNMFLMAYCFSGDLTAAAGVLRKMEEEGHVADSRTFHALVLGACKVGKVETAMVVLRRMVDDGVPMSYSTHMVVIGALLKMKCYEQALKYVRSFGGKDKKMDTELFGCLGSKLMVLKRVEEAMSILHEMKQRDLPMGYKLRDFYEMNVGMKKQ